MKKIILPFFVALSFYIVYANENDNDDDDKIVLSDNCHYTETRRDEIPVFHAIINNDCSIMVSTDRPADFEVMIFDSNGLNVRYRGVTINNVLHITAQSFSVGQYTLQITTNECTYTGVFEISHSL